MNPYKFQISSCLQQLPIKISFYPKTNASISHNYKWSVQWMKIHPKICLSIKLRQIPIFQYHLVYRRNLDTEMFCNIFLIISSASLSYMKVHMKVHWEISTQVTQWSFVFDPCPILNKWHPASQPFSLESPVDLVAFFFIHQQKSSMYRMPFTSAHLLCWRKK